MMFLGFLGRGGFFWTAYAWNGVAAFLALMLAVAFALAGRFLR